MERSRTRSVFCIIYVIITAIEANVTCTVDDTSYVCKNIDNKNDIPHALPSHTRKVTLIGTDELKGYFPIAVFSNQTWANVSELSILKFLDVHFFPRDVLDGLEHLQFLSISSCPELRRIDPDVFHNMPDLQALYLDENPNLQISSVEAALTGKLSKLKYLSLIAIQARTNHAVLGLNFSKALQGKTLTYLDLSRANIASIAGSLNEIFPTIKYLNFSYSSLVLLGLQFNVHEPGSSLELLDVSGCRTIIESYNNTRDKTKNCQFAPKLKYLYLKNIVDVRGGMTVKSTHTYQQCENKQFILLDLSNNDIIILNMTIFGELYFYAFQILDLNGNNMEYISPSVLGIFPFLKILDLSKNQLHKMQNMDNFINIFSRNKELEILFLRSNFLSVVPANIFSSNIKLRVLDLSENELTHLNTEWYNMQDLKMIDLRKNWLKWLPIPFAEQLDNIFCHQATLSKQETSMTNTLIHEFFDRHILAERYRYGYSARKKEQLKNRPEIIPQYLTITISENPILCDCDKLDFLQWLVTTKISIVNRTTLLCNFGNHEIVLDYKGFETVKQICRLPVIIGTAIASSLVIILGFSILVIIRRHRHKMSQRHKDIGNLKRAIVKGSKQFKFVVFLVYCSKDHYIVEENIRQSLNTYLKKSLNTDQDLVCTGADSFVPGMRIIDEIHRCIDESLIVVPVITPAFLQSQWSQEECAVAIAKHRKVVLLVEQYTDTSMAITPIKHMIERYTRASWSINEGHFVIRPPWNAICQGVIDIGADTLRNYRKQNDDDSNDSVSLLEEKV